MARPSDAHTGEPAGPAGGGLLSKIGRGISVLRALGWKREPIVKAESRDLPAQPVPLLPNGGVRQLSDLRQGDVFDLTHLPVIEGNGHARWLAAAHGVVVVSQTCDLVLKDRPTAQLAPVVLLDAVDAKPARSGRKPNLVHVPELGPTAFVDLSLVSTVDKSLLLETRSCPGVTTIHDVRKFGLRVGRRFSRFPFPDEVVPWIRPLKSLVESKDGKVQSPQGWAFDQVASLRLECESDWDSAPYSLKLCVILNPGILPIFPSDEMPEISQSLNSWLNGTGGRTMRDANDIASRLMRDSDSLDANSRYFLWSALADAWASRCQPPADEPECVVNAVEDGQFSSDLVSADEFTLDRYWSSEEIDVDHLSPPPPQRQSKA